LIPVFLLGIVENHILTRDLTAGPFLKSFHRPLHEVRGRTCPRRRWNDPGQGSPFAKKGDGTFAGIRIKRSCYPLMSVDSRKKARDDCGFIRPRGQRPSPDIETGVPIQMTPQDVLSSGAVRSGRFTNRGRGSRNRRSRDATSPRSVEADDPLTCHLRPSTSRRESI
jgi:hypothetical protein